MDLKLNKITCEADILFLYVLLEERPGYCNIGHRAMPSYEEHKSFVESHPYDLWFIVFDGDVRVGSIYKTKMGEIGIFVKKEFQRKGIATKVIPMVYDIGSKDNFANINPMNKLSILMFRRLGFVHIQNTYKLERLPNVDKKGEINLEGFQYGELVE